jgi:uncharacterized phage protein gp47/JayE
MANLNVQSFDQLVASQAAAIQGSASPLLDFSIGSILRAIAEGNAGVLLWLQGLIIQVLTTTRAATSAGADLDSWVADYGVSRLSAVPASGQVTFSRFFTTAQVVVPVGAVVQTADNSQKFTVTLDPTNSAWSAALGGYVLAPGVASLTVPAQAEIAGSAGNVMIGAISSMATVNPGLDTVTNAAPFVNGLDAESDPALRNRFGLYVASLAKATKTAIGSAIASVRQGLSYTVVEATNYVGQAQPGSFYVVVDDGSGNPPQSLLTAVAAAIDAIRPVGTCWAVFGPTIVTANPTMTVVAAGGYTHGAVAAAVANAIGTTIGGLGLGVSLPWSQLAAVAWGVPGVANVTGLTLNGGTADLLATPQQVIRVGTITVN